MQIFLPLWASAFGVSDNAVAVLWPLLEFVIPGLDAIRKDGEVKLPKTPIDSQVICQCGALHNVDDAQARARREIAESHSSDVAFIPDAPRSASERKRDAAAARAADEELVQGKLFGVCGAPGPFDDQPRCERLLFVVERSVPRPLRLYPSVSIASHISRLLSRPNFLALANTWRDRPMPADAQPVIGDVHDARVWREFHQQLGFFDQRASLAFQLNYDDCVPFAHTPGLSYGAFYLCCLNLPANVRYVALETCYVLRLLCSDLQRMRRMQRENILVLGLTPFKVLDIMPCLRKYVEEFKSLWNVTRIDGHPVRAALLCVANDTIAARKIGAFLGVGAAAGCPRCTKVFLRRPNAKGGWTASYTDFTACPPRTRESLAAQAAQYRQCETKKGAEALASRTGVRYSPLLELPYFDLARFIIVDGMHALYIGVMKLLITLFQTMPLRSSRLSHPNNKFAVLLAPHLAFKPIPFPALPRALRPGDGNARWRLCLCSPSGCTASRLCAPPGLHRFTLVCAFRAAPLRAVRRSSCSTRSHPDFAVRL